MNSIKSVFGYIFKSKCENAQENNRQEINEEDKKQAIIDIKDKYNREMLTSYERPSKLSVKSNCVRCPICKTFNYYDQDLKRCTSCKRIFNKKVSKLSSKSTDSFYGENRKEVIEDVVDDDDDDLIEIKSNDCIVVENEKKKSNPEIIEMNQKTNEDEKVMEIDDEINENEINEDEIMKENVDLKEIDKINDENEGNSELENEDNKSEISEDENINEEEKTSMNKDIPTQSKSPICVVKPNINKDDEDFENKEYDLSVNKVCLGNYECTITKVILTSLGLQLKFVPSSLTRIKYHIFIPRDEIERMYTCFRGADSVSVITFQTIDESTNKIRSALNIDGKDTIYIYDTQNLSKNLNFIILRIDNVSDEIQNLFERVFYRIANDKGPIKVTYIKMLDILRDQFNNIKNAYQSDLSNNANRQIKNSQNISKSKLNKIEYVDLDDNHVENASEVILNYPPNENEVITIYKTDMGCLLDGEYLNDTIIGFYLKYILREKVEFPVASKTFMFSTFFYGKLTKSRKDEDPKKLPELKYYDRVKSWTKSQDIFEKDFLVIPMNKSCHWFLAIVCYPSLVPDDNNIPNSEDQFTKTNKRPCIIYMDSLGVASGRNRLSNPLRFYLTMEWKEKRKSNKCFSHKVLPDYYPVVPQQTNTSDCGLFVLQYVEEFLRDPDKFLYNIQENRFKNWFSLNVIETKRTSIINLINTLSKSKESSSSSEDNDNYNDNEDEFYDESDENKEATKRKNIEKDQEADASNKKLKN